MLIISVIAILLVQTKSACIISFGEIAYEFANQEITVVDETAGNDSQHVFEIALCGNQVQACGGERENTAVYVRDQNQCQFVLAYWDQVQANPLDRSAKTDVFGNATSNEMGLTLAFANGQACNNKPLELALNLVCGHVRPAGYQKKNEPCKYVINLPIENLPGNASSLCSLGTFPPFEPTFPHSTEPGPHHNTTKPQPVTTMPPKEHYGYIILISGGSAIFLYFIGFYTFNCCRGEEVCSEKHCPNNELWAACCTNCCLGWYVSVMCVGRSCKCVCQTCFGCCKDDDYKDFEDAE